MKDNKYNLAINIKHQFEEVVSIIRMHQSRALQGVNTEHLQMVWSVGAYVSAKLRTQEWGNGVVKQLSEFIKVIDPQLKGYSRRNIYNMVNLYETYSSKEFDDFLNHSEVKAIVQSVTAQLYNHSVELNNVNKNAIVQSATAQLPSFLLLTSFTNHIAIINHCDNMQERLFYILYTHKERLNVRELQRCIATDTFAHVMKGKQNMAEGLKATYPNLLLKDKVYVDFLNLPAKYSEKKLESELIKYMKQFILELGKDFLFVDSQYPLEVGDSVFKIDLLFFHRGLQCLVAVELKNKKFHPSQLGQLEFYLEALDRDVKRSNENPSIGILLCPSADKNVVEYAMSRNLSPTMIAEYKQLLIPKEKLQASFDEFCAFFKSEQ